MTHTPPKQIDEHFINSLLDAVIEKNKPLLAELLDKFPNTEEQTRTRTLFEISMAPDDDVHFIISYLLNDVNKNAGYKNALLDLLIDKARTNSKFIVPFIENADQAQLKSAVPIFATILLNETDTAILQKTIEAIGVTGEKSCINVIADFIFYDHDELKRAAIDALGKIGGTSTLERLEFASQTSKSDEYLISTLERLKSQLSPLDTVDIVTPKQFASKNDIIEGMTDDSDIAQLIYLLNSKLLSEQLLAIDSLIEIGPQAIPTVAENMNLSEPDSIVNSLLILGNSNSEMAFPPVLKILGSRHEDPNVRFAAYEAISRLPRAHSSVSLIDGINDPSEPVRIAAAAAIDNNLSDILASGLIGRIETSGRHSKRANIAAAIIDSHAGQIFSRLLSSDSFVFLATDYLSGCHESTISFFSDILIKRGVKSLARTIRENTKQRPTDNPLTIFCVDGSQIGLKYCTKIFHGMGHRPYLFSSTVETIINLKKSKPDILMIDIDSLGPKGLQLADQVREYYSLEDLPIVQLSCRKTDSRGNSRVNLIHQKPLDSKTMKQLLDKIHV